MKRLDLSKNLAYRHASLRYFNPGEYHCTRICNDDVLFMVLDGVLRINEDGIDYEIGPGEYHIYRHGGYQLGKYPSDSPKYLYVHFSGEWTEDESGLSPDGNFDYATLKPLMKELDVLQYSRAPYILQVGKFYEIISHLYNKKVSLSFADEIAQFIENRYKNDITLEDIANHFKFSKNHIINVFKKEYGMTPFEYISSLRIRYAERLLERTSRSLEEIAAECGFNDYSHFYRQFKEINKVSPMEWRKKKRIQPYETKKVLSL